MGRDCHSQPGRGGAGTADPADADPAYVGDHPGVDKLPLARQARASPGTRPSPPGTRPSPPGTRPSPARTPSPAGTPSPPGTRSPAGGTRPSLPGLARQLGLFACYLAAGVAVTWPRATYLGGSLPSTRDAAGYVWGFWWLARQVTHLGNPWATSYLGAPVGTQLAYHTLMPLPGALMTPVTLVFGPSVVVSLAALTGAGGRVAAARGPPARAAVARLLPARPRPGAVDPGPPYHPYALTWQGVRMSAVVPFTWFVRLAGLANFREAARFTELGLAAAALLAGAGVSWLGAHARPVVAVVLALGILEAGWSGNLTTRMWPIGVMPTTLPALDAPIAADHSHSIVVDVPFGIRGGLPVAGSPFPPESMVLATADGHPLADVYVSRIPSATLAGIVHRPFYAALLRVQAGLRPNSPRSCGPRGAMRE